MQCVAVPKKITPVDLRVENEKRGDRRVRYDIEFEQERRKQCKYELDSVISVIPGESDAALRNYGCGMWWRLESKSVDSRATLGLFHLSIIAVRKNAAGTYGCCHMSLNSVHFLKNL